MRTCRMLGVALACAVIVPACSLVSLDGYTGGALDSTRRDSGPIEDDLVTEGGADVSPKNDYRAAVLAAHPIAYWRFEETTGPTFKDEVSGREAVAVGLCNPAVVSAPGLSGRALGFDGATCRLDAGQGLAFVGRAKFSVEVWVLQSARNAYQHLFTRQDRDQNDPRDGYALLLGPGGSAYVERALGGAIRATQPTPIPSFVFSHVVGTYDGEQLHLYIDGKLAKNEDDARSLASVTVSAIVGENSTSKGWFTGSMDELAIYDDALSAETVAAHFALGSKAP